MCGRYTGYVDESDELKTIYTLAQKSYPNTVFKTGEIFPTNTAPIIIQNKINKFSKEPSLPKGGGTVEDGGRIDE